MSQLPHSFTDISAETPRLGWVSSWNMLSLCCAALYRHSCKATRFQNPSISFFLFFILFLQPRHQMFLQPRWPCKTITPDLSGKKSAQQVTCKLNERKLVRNGNTTPSRLLPCQGSDIDCFFPATQNPFGQFPLINPRQQTEPPKLKQFSKAHFKCRAQ